jgi:PKD repeat protein
MANQLNEFDKAIKESLEGFEVPYNPEHWDELKIHLAATTPPLSKYFSAITTGIAATGIVFMSVMFLASNDSGKTASSVTEVEELVSETGNSNRESETTFKTSGSSDLEVTEEGVEASKEANEEVFTQKNVKSKGESPSQKVATEPQTEVLDQSVDNAGKNLSNESDKSENNLTKGCTGLTIEFNGSDKYGKDAKFLWNFGDGFFSNEANPSHTFKKEGTFDVSLSVTSKENGQIQSNLVQAMIEISEAPLASIEVEIIDTERMTLSDRSHNASSSSWIVDSKVKTGADDSIELQMADNTRYEVEFVANNNAGCTDTLVKNINIVQAGSQFPKALDFAYSTSFAPGAVIDTEGAPRLKIFSSKGEMIFESEGSKGWDGTNPNGEKVKPGEYKWVMIIEDESSLDIVKGTLSVR